MVRNAKSEGLAITAEVTPHHLALSDAAVQSYDPVYKVNPPLRTASDVLALRAGLASGVIDAIATDHAPHAPERKEEPFDDAPAGMIGLETALAVAYGALCAGPGLSAGDGEVDGWVPRGDGATMSLRELLGLFSWKAARIAGLDQERDGAPHGVRPERRMGRRHDAAGEPQPQYALCRPPAHGQGPPHCLCRRGSGPRRRGSAMNGAVGQMP
jgi:hypothetical protein